MHHPPNKAESVQIQDGWVAGTFSSRALWCSNSNFSALSTSISLVMPAGTAPAACLPSSRGTAPTGKPGTPGAPAAAAGQGQRSIFNLIHEFRADNSSQPHAIARNMLRHIKIPPVLSKVRVDFPRGPIVNTPHFCRGHRF